MFSLVFVLVGRLAGRGCGSHGGLTVQGLQSVVGDCCVFVCLNGGVMAESWWTMDRRSTPSGHLTSSVLNGHCQVYKDLF